MTFDPNEQTSSTTAPLAPASAPAAVPAPVVVPAKRRGIIDYVLAGALVLAVGGVAFAAGRTTAPAEASGPGLVTDPGNGGFGPIGSFDPGAGGPGGGVFGGGLTVEGVVKSIDGSSMVIETSDGTELTVALDGETTYHEATSTDPDAVTAGDNVTVRMSGGRFGPGGGNGGEGGGGDTPTLAATDVTIER